MYWSLTNGQLCDRASFHHDHDGDFFDLCVPIRLRRLNLVGGQLVAAVNLQGGDYNYYDRYNGDGYDDYDCYNYYDFGDCDHYNDYDKPALCCR